MQNIFFMTLGKVKLTREMQFYKRRKLAQFINVPYTLGPCVGLSMFYGNEKQKNMKKKKSKKEHKS